MFKIRKVSDVIIVRIMMYGINMCLNFLVKFWVGDWCVLVLFIMVIMWVSVVLFDNLVIFILRLLDLLIDFVNMWFLVFSVLGLVVVFLWLVMGFLFMGVFLFVMGV